MVSRLRQKLSDPKRPPAPFVVGVNRSGTTLLRLMLDAHPELTIPPETHFIPEVIRRANHENTRRRLIRSITKHPRWGDFGLDEEELRARAKQVRPLTAGDAIRCFYELYAERQGKPRWGDKTPRYMRAMPRISRALPEARFVHLIRDGRDVALSQRERVIDGAPLPMAAMAERWQRRIIAAREGAAEIRARATWRSATRTWSPTPRAPCGGSASSSSSTSTRRCSTTTSAPPSGSRRWTATSTTPTTGSCRTGDQPARRPRADHRAPDHRPQRPLAHGDDRGGAGRVRGVAGELLAELGYELSTDRTAAGEGVE